MTRKKRRHSSFDILNAAAFGYRLAWRQWPYIAATGLVPFVIGCITTMFVLQMEQKAGSFEQFLWNLPSTVVSGWFMFLIMRLAVFGERVDQLKQDINLLLQRARLLRVSVIIWVLINMGIAVITAYLFWAMSKMDPANQQASALMIPNMAVIALCLWGVRLLILHLLAAVDYPIKPYIFKVNGIGISFRLIGLGILCFLPAALLQQMILRPFVADIEDINALGTGGLAAFSIVTGLFSIAVTAIMTAAVAEAMRQQLGGRKGGKKITA